MNTIYIGLISGTSVDGIDAVVIDFGDKAQQSVKLMATQCSPIPAKLTEQITQLCDEKITQGEINAMAGLDRKLGKLFSQAALSVCTQAGLNPQDITAIGHHGQTIRHYPQGIDSNEEGFTLQIGDANTLAIETGINVVADFRRKDIALGGQGAPMVPAFHQAAFRSDTIPRFIVNIGGISNLTYLPPKLPATSSQSDKSRSQQVLGYDTGPGNTLLDKWAMQHINQPFDDNGQWASTGKLIEPLLHDLLTHPYLALPAPKSTGREDFNRSWLNQHLKDHYKPCDVQATLVHLTALTIAQQIEAIAESANTVNQSDVQPTAAHNKATPECTPEVYICGGGASNGYLLKQLTAQLPGFKVATTTALGINPDWVEAIAFAWLAQAYVEKIPGNIPSVTGASRETILGGMYLP